MQARRRSGKEFMVFCFRAKEPLPRVGSRPLCFLFYTLCPQSACRMTPHKPELNC